MTRPRDSRPTPRTGGFGDPGSIRSAPYSSGVGGNLLDLLDVEDQSPVTGDNATIYAGKGGGPLGVPCLVSEYKE